MNPKRRVYSIRDKKLDQFQNLCFFDNDNVAVRAFGDLVLKDTESIIHNHPSDFSLCFVGEFDSVTGIFEQPPQYIVIADADSFMKAN